MRSGKLAELVLALELEGHVPGTPKFEALLRQRKVETCVEMKGLASCNSCPAYFSCELLKHHLRDLNYGVDDDGSAREQ